MCSWYPWSSWSERTQRDADSSSYISFVGYLTTLAVMRPIMNWKGLGRKRSWPNGGTLPAFAWKDRIKPRKVSVRIAEIRT